VDLIKLDFITPGSPDNGGHLPPDNSGSVIAYHKAINASGHAMRLDISWKLERNATFLPIWSANADSMRTDQDINNSGKSTFVAWATVQRAIDNYRDFINQIVSSGAQPSSTIYPDMDNLFVGNNESITGVSDTMRETMASHWIGAAANLITGSDLTQLDATGKRLLTDANAMAAANFTAKFPMQARNPGTGSNDAKQLQAWIAGPGDNENSILLLANYGPDQGQGGFGTSLSGKQHVEVTWADLGISGEYNAKNIWTGEVLGTFDSAISADLDEGESLFLSLFR
jgi:alpha-galactosidase